MFIIRKATLEDVDELVKLRMELLREISEVDEHYIAELDDDYMAKLADAIREYFAAKIPENEFIAWIAEDEGKIIASSGLVFHEKPPIHGNLTGREAYIMNMYTLPEW
ncbi:MAG: GNAT family N-acetyltransferase, partial [Candidatus Hodarchaeota archaeon]